MAQFAEWVGTVVTAVDGTFSGAFPAGLFTVTPTIFASVVSSTQFALAAALANSPTAFSGRCCFFPGLGAASTTAGFTVAIRAVEPMTGAAVG